MTKYLFSLACLLALTACESMSPPTGEPMPPSAGTAPAAMDNQVSTPPIPTESIAPAGAMMPPDAGAAGQVIAPK
ncbi:hypothetical protein [Actimicrobium sp. CCI2.3]|uniref:hypothetical protein n=1 Tax=Actimicrobium sp. CCI2.3 TaxID=3048616 RepID=UPI002AB56C33|nr:hypothetical protein [Actimicrobium sp. CCI2.3]MDY7576617.1 hypothetical protein [Actimicrobium sp. CCI2.3]MEB0021218.1 hypothetical protein [Actimicrobium sp. CCI2.3]